MTEDLQTEMTNFGRSLSSGPLLSQNVQPWVTRMQRKIRAVYEAITCTRTSDVVQQHPSTRPPRSSMKHRHHPRPRLDQQPTTTPPRPNQAVGVAGSHIELHVSVTTIGVADHGTPSRPSRKFGVAGSHIELPVSATTAAVADHDTTFIPAG